MRPIYLLDWFTGSVFHDAVINAYMKNKQIWEQNEEIIKAQGKNTKQGVHSFIDSTTVAKVIPVEFVI